MAYESGPRKKVNYLSNKELLKELAMSKASYCEFTDKKYSVYDMIVTSIAAITPEVIAEAKEIRADYINFKLLEEQLNHGLTNKEANEKIAPHKVTAKNITKTQLCFRIMTRDHIPEEIKANAKLASMTLAFHPFKHYAFVNSKWQEVGRSHWSGTFKAGSFTPQRGKLTNKLVRSLMMLVDRFSQKGNFRNYTYLDDMKGQALMQLSHVALKFDESKSDNPFAFYTTCIKHCFIKILKEEKKMRKIRDDLIAKEGLMPSYSYMLDNESADFYDQPKVAEPVVAIPE